MLFLGLWTQFQSDFGTIFFPFFFLVFIISIITIFFLVLSVVGDKLGLRFFVGEDCKWWFRRLVFFFSPFFGGVFLLYFGIGVEV